MSDRPIRVGVAGCGGIARQTHLRLLPRLPGMRVVALADHNEASRANAGRLVPAAAVFDDVIKMLDQAELDAVVVALPTFAHAEAAVAVLESGRHLFLESPLAPNPEAGERIVDAWRRAGRVGMIGLSSRYHPLLADVKRLLDGGEIGVPVGARIAFSSRAGSRPPWAQDPERGGGVLLDKAYHEIDLARFLFGEVTEVCCRAAASGTRPETVSLELGFDGTCIAQLLISVESVADARLDVYGRGGKLSVGRYDSLRVAVSPASAGGFFDRVRRGVSEIAGIPFLWRKLRSPGHDPSFVAALRHFETAVRHSTPAAPDLADGLACLGIAEAARQSLREGRPVAIDTRHGG